MSLTSETKLFLGMIGVTVLILIGAVFFLSRPAATLDRSQLITNETLTTGNASASAYLVEFSDFQCPACRAYQPAVKQILSQYKDQLTFAYRHFPLDQHPLAIPAAKAAEAAGKQGKFWEAHDQLFIDQDKFSDEYFVQFAQLLQLDKSQFDKDKVSGDVKDKIERDRVAGLGFGVNATPTFFLNGQKLNLTTPEELVNAVTKAINESR